jgi:hypothetical protein
MHKSAASIRLSWSLPQPLAALGPPLLFAIRLWASVRLALFTAFWLELDSSYWAGGMAAIVCQPRLGASLRKGWFRMIGTIVGALLIVTLTACFPQDRVGYLGSLALFCSLSRSLPLCCAILRPTRLRSPARPRPSSPPISARRAERARTSFWWRSIAPAISASQSRE